EVGPFYALAIVFGVAYGGVMPLYALVTREYFGEKVMGAAYGGVFLVSTLGMGLGAFAGGVLYDRLGSYTWLYAGSFAVGTVAVTTGGIEGVLAARRAPAFAQGTKLHWVRWVDFIPESDVELKRQMPEASKALGAEVTLETINANDLQPRITAAIQSGSGADI